MPVSPVTSYTIGASLALGTAVCWAVSPLCFASAGRRIGSYPVVTLRAVLAGVLLLALMPVYAVVSPQPITAPSASQSFWLALSALTGMVVGDICLFESFVRIGPRRSSQIQTLAPVAAIIVGWIWLGERMTLQPLAGIVLVLCATSWAIIASPAATDDRAGDPGHLSVAGVGLAVVGAVLVGIGSVTARIAFRSGQLDAALATTMRVVFAAVLLLLIPLARRQLRSMFAHLRDPIVLTRIIPGTIIGPFLGMICYLFALKLLEAGLVSTLVALSPVFILPMVAVRYRVRLGADVIVATVLAAAGVALIWLRKS